MQRIERVTERHLPVIDCSGGDKNEEQARGAIKAFVNKPMDLMKGPTFDLLLVKLSEQDHVIACLWDHSNMDRTSIVLFFEELWTFYADMRLGKPFSIQRGATQYADYAVWQRKTHPAWLAEHRDYWSETLAAGTLLQIPTDEVSSEIEAETGGFVRFSLDLTLKNPLSDLAQHHRVSMGMTMLALLSVLALRFCNQRDFVIPFNVSGRRYPEDSQVIGLFTGPLLLRIHVSESATFVETLKRVSKVLFIANKHSDYDQNALNNNSFQGVLFNWLPWAFRIDMSAQPPRDQQVVCPVAVPFALDPAKNVDNTATFRWPAPNTWHLELHNMPESIDGVLLYRADLFKRSTVECFVRGLMSISKQVGENPRARLSSLSCSHEQS